MLEEFQEMYGKIDGIYWWAVREYEKAGGDGKPHRVFSDVGNKEVVLRDENLIELARYRYEKPSKRAKGSTSKKYTPEPEQLEDPLDGSGEPVSSDAG